MGNNASCFAGLAASPGGHTKEAPCIDLEALREKLGELVVDKVYHTSEGLASCYKVSSTVLGSGLNGDVRLAEREGAKYAVKSFRKHRLSQEQRAELKNEVEILLSIEHPHVVRLQDVYDTNREVYLVMELMAGGELYDRLKSAGAYSEQRAAATLRQMLLAVSHLHDRGIVHRDLKLENFLYTDENTDNLKLIDFGFAQEWDLKGKMKKQCGTLHYVAPEVLKGSYDEKCDCWSLGVLAHMLLTGRAPFHGHTDDQVMKKIESGFRDPCLQFSALSEPAQSFINELLVVDPGKRLSAKDALAHAFLAAHP